MSEPRHSVSWQRAAARRPGRHWLAALALAAAGLAAPPARAQDAFPPDFFALQKSIKPDAANYPKLSPTELGTLRPGPVYYPFILEAWAVRPLSGAEHFSRRNPEFVPDETVRLQSYVFARVKNPFDRAHTLAQLAYARNRTATAYLLPALARESDPAVTADFLHTLVILQAAVPAADLQQYLKAADALVRRNACRLYAGQTAAQPAFLLSLAGAETDPDVRQLACELAATLAAKSTVADWLPLLRGADPQAAAAALPAVLSLPEQAAAHAELQRWAAGADPAVKVALLQHLGPATAREVTTALMRPLAADPHGSVRAEAAAAIDRLALEPLLPELLTLAGDPLPDVRRLAATACRHFPRPPIFAALVTLSGDAASALTRQAARDSLIALSRHYPVAEQLGEHLGAANEEIRLSACLVLATVGSQRHHARLTAALPRETRPENVAATIAALTAGGAQDAEAAIVRLAKAEAPEIRASVAEAVGRLRLASGFAAIKDYAQSDTAAPVRTAAVMAMGHLADPQFSPVLLAILRRTNYSGKELLTGQDRANACWSVSRFASPGADLLQRLTEHVERPVIVTPMGPAFDNNDVRVSATWALATIAKRTQDAQVLGLAQRAIAALRGQDSASALVGPSPPSGPDLRAYAYQARQFLDGGAVAQTPLEPVEWLFNLRRAPPPPGN